LLYLFNLLVNLFFLLLYHPPPLILIFRGYSTEVYHGQWLQHLRVGVQFPLLKEHARFVCRAEGEGEGLGLARLKDTVRVVAVETLGAVRGFRRDKVTTENSMPVIRDSGGSDILEYN
jgi:hypothetical protein